MTIAPLEDPAYKPLHPPVNGRVPGVVAKWGPRSQLRWFDRFAGQLKPMPHKVWDQFYCVVLAHRGQCCTSCLQDKEDGYGGDIDGCCCAAIQL